jgi:ribosomal protein L37AE/L43A
MDKQELAAIRESACCAHLNVLYEKGMCDGQNICGEVVPNGAAYDIWKCRDCGTRFTPVSALSDSEGLVKELATALNGSIAYMEKVEDSLLVGDEGCHWPVEIVRELLNRPEVKRILEAK